MKKKEKPNHLRWLTGLVWFEGNEKRFLKFCVVGASGTIVNLGLLALFTEVFGLFYIFSAAISYETSILTNFAFNEIWTFRDQRSPGVKSVLSRLLKFNLVSAGGLAIHMAILSFLTEVVGLFYFFSAIFAIAGAVLWNFNINIRWTWRVKSRSEPTL